MKKKDIVALVVSIAIFMVAGGLIYRYVVPPPKNTGIKVEIPHKVTTTFKENEYKGIINTLTDTTNGVTDFTPSIDPDQNAKPQPVIQ